MCWKNKIQEASYHNVVVTKGMQEGSEAAACIEHSGAPTEHASVLEALSDESDENIPTSAGSDQSI